MIDISYYIEEMRDFLTENRKRTIIICALLIFMALSAVILLMQAMPPAKKKKAQTEQKKLVLTEELMPPLGPEVPDGYVTSREPKAKWTEEEAAEWFTVPDEIELKKLGDANDRIVNDITGAAP